MRQVFLFISTLMLVLGVHAQTAVNQDGSIKFRGNVAIFVDSKCYTFSNGQAVKSIDNGTSMLLKTSLRAIAMEKFQNLSFGIVNRDDEAAKQVEALIEEIEKEYHERSEQKERDRLVEAFCTNLGGNLKEDILREGVGKRQSSEELMERVAVYIREHLTEPITVKELSAEFGLVAPYLGKLFKDYTGYTPGQYIQMLRIEHAKCLLSVNEELLAKDVAGMVGYSDPVHFSKLFKKKVGVWPSEFKGKKNDK